MIVNGRRKVLVAPLDWGLGHTTRCIPVIRELLKTGFEVVIAAEGKGQTLLEAEFPSLAFITLKGYAIQYSKTRIGLFSKILLQIPKIMAIIRYEHNWLDEIIDRHGIDIVISDNRYGLHSKRIPSLFITHQLQIQTPVFSNLLRRLNYRYINRFTECWVPDSKNVPGLAGKLSHPGKLPSIPVKYIGVLSRFEYVKEEHIEKKLLVILSGPEPQRTLLEKKVLPQLGGLPFQITLIRGLPGASKTIETPPHVRAINHLAANELGKEIREAFLIIARSGYSTIMDLVKMRKKSILIPTPGQTEQEYLAKHLSEKGIACSMQQKDLNLKKALDLAASFPYKINMVDEIEALEKAIQDL